MQPDQVPHGELPVPGGVDHVLEARSFDEEVRAIGQHLVMHQRMLGPKLLTEVAHGPPNLRQFHPVLSPQRIEDVRFGQVVERQPCLERIRERDDRLGPPGAAGPHGVRAPGYPGAQRVLPDVKVARRLENAVQRQLEDLRPRVQLLEFSPFPDCHGAILPRGEPGDNVGQPRDHPRRPDMQLVSRKSRCGLGHS